MFKRDNLLFQAVSRYLIVSMIVLPVQALAGEHTDSAKLGREAQSFAENHTKRFFEVAPKGSTTSMQVPVIKDGQFSTGTETLSFTELGPSDAVTGEIFPTGQSLTVEQLQSLFEDEQGMGNLGSAAKKGLFQDANSNKPSYSGSAYKMMLDIHNRIKPDLTNDPMFNAYQALTENMDAVAEGFADCTIDKALTESNKQVHLPDYKQCTRVVDKSAQCEVIHAYEANVIQHYAGPFNLKNCGTGCTDLWIGRQGDNYWGGHCSIYEQSTTVMVINPKAITRAVLNYAKWDDYMQVWIGEPGKEKKVWGGPYGMNTFPPETGGRCELSTSWSQNPNFDVTEHFKNVEPGAIINFKIRASVTGGGEAYGRINIQYDPDQAVSNDVWSPQECIDAATGVHDGFASGSFSCTENGADANGCVVMNGIKVCEPHLEPSPIPGIPNTCRRVAVNADFDFNQGQGSCWIDPQGEQQCIENQGGHNNTCQTLESDPKCGFISSACVDGATGKSGTCYVQEDTFDCGESISVPSVELEEEFTCSGDIACLGGECIDVSKEQSQDFAEAVAMLNVAQFVTQDMECTEIDGTDNVTCRIFAGKPSECKIAVGGMQDCCDSPTQVSLNDYIGVIMATSRLHSSAMAVKDATGMLGSYQTLATNTGAGFQELTKPFTSFAEGIVGETGIVADVTSWAEGAFSSLKDKLKQVIGKAIGNLGSTAGGAGGAAVSPEAAEKAAEELYKKLTESAVGDVLGALNYAYMAYAMARLIVGIVWKCEEEELELSGQVELKNCAYIGSYCNSDWGVCVEKRKSYCCFASPLSRIIQQQARPQLGMSFGSPEALSCDGLPLEAIGQINWSQVNLDEWIGILQATGNMPDVNMNIESLTGDGSMLKIGTTRPDAVERTLSRYGELNGDELRTEVRDGMDVMTGGE